MSTAPLPSRLVLLANLVNCRPRDKVRFLGCVDDYDVHGAALALTHRHSSSSPAVVAIVNIQHVLQSIKREDMEVGAWINVMGYVMEDQGRTVGAVPRILSSGKAKPEKYVRVQALTVWSAGDVDLDSYTDAVLQRQSSQ
ncbi:hypothetical protein GQ43DRAFT_480920 [Delitschia confertaspora ATCC 74209]|uniref:Uncharacterized protein n=1 Tax=Delitschia confertaspora ATCC 74209 TaxID=1513339 RepID=A0A9P4JKK5_9PLEO|nr:hypothetical protein GQ43DRAFT_480920 [Delitschia confertaspora ATCC 74209]